MSHIASLTATFLILQPDQTMAQCSHPVSLPQVVEGVAPSEGAEQLISRHLSVSHRHLLHQVGEGEGEVGVEDPKPQLPRQQW